MFPGWLQLGGTEVANTARFRTYVNAELPGLLDDCDCECDLLHEVVGDKPYTTPVSDGAPWVEADNPDTWGFYGMMPLSITGLQDAEREYDVTELVTDGAFIGRKRRPSKEFRVRGLLAARNEQAMEAGWSWFKNSMEGNCNSHCTGGGAHFCWLKSCPTSLEDMGLWEEVPVDVSRSSDTSVRFWTEQFYPPLPCDEIQWYFSLSSSYMSTARIIVRTHEKILFEYTAQLTEDEQEYMISDMGMAETTVWAEVIGNVNVHHTARRRARTRKALQPCIDLYSRQLRNVVAIEGPRVIRELSPSQGALREVEVTFLAASPWTYGAPVPIATVDRGVPSTFNGSILTNTDSPPPPCEEVPASWRDFIVDPNCKIDPPPPLPPAQISHCNDDILWYNFAHVVEIPPEAVPLWNDTVPTLKVEARGPVRGVRVRFLLNHLGLPLNEIEPCSECASFTISYIPPGATYVVDGETERAYIEIADQQFPARQYLGPGRPGTEYTWPALTCGVGYFVVIEIAAENDIAGIELSLTPRE